MASQKKIAEKLGIAPSTVSRALRAEGRISPETRRLIQEAALELGYDIAPAMKRPALERILVAFLNKWAAEFLGSTILGMSSAAGEKDIRLVTPSRKAFLTSPALLQAYVEKEECQAVIVGLAGAGRAPLAELQQLEAAGVTVVLLNRYEGCTMNAVTLDEYAAGETAAQFLYDLGHRRIAYVAGPCTYSCYRQRAAGFIEACRVMGIYDPALVQHLGQFQRPLSTMRDEIDRIFRGEGEPPTAVFAANDLVAQEVIHIAQSRGIRAPEDLSVIGFDNIELAEHIGLTTFDFRRFELGRQAVKLAVEAHAGIVETPVHVALPPRLVCRSSTRHV